MKRTVLARPFAVALVLGGLFFALAWSADAADDTTADEKRAFGESGNEMIPAAAFSVSGFDPDGHQFWAAEGCYRGTSTTSGCIKAPVYLPRYAKVTQVQATVYDNDGIEDVLIHLNRVDRTSGTVLTMAEVETSIDGTSLQYPLDDSIEEPVIQYPDYSYYVGTCLNSASLRLYGVNISYEAALFRDGFESSGTDGWSLVSP